MEKKQLSIYLGNCIMKKIFIPLVLVVIGASSQAQSLKKPPPPPPPKPKNEVVKFLPPKIVIDEKVDVSKNEPPVITVKGKVVDEFYTRNPSVSHISRQGNVITLKKKDNSVEEYDMSKKEEDKNFNETYGVSPIPPPPPPPIIVKKKSKT